MLNKNSRVLITGGSRGIGLALAQKFHKKGLQVHSVSRVISKNFGTNHFQHQCDLIIDKTINRIYQKIHR